MNFTGEIPNEYLGQDSFFEGNAPLSIGVGYGIVLGFGMLSTIVISGMVWLDSKFNGTQINSEEFSSAGRSVKTGLVASVIVSQWTWAATLLQSSNVAYLYGISGPFWYASGASIQVLLFGVLAIEVKRKAPRAHTFLEIILARWGHRAHFVFLWFACLTNTLVSSMLLLGGSATVSALTGLDVDLACFLIPLGIISYTFVGGLKATFLSSYINTAIIFIALLVIIFVVYTDKGAGIGSISSMYDKLVTVSSYTDAQCEEIGTLDACGGVRGNFHGSYMTMMSLDGFIFGLINIVGNFGTVFLDQAYWQCAFAAKPASSHKAYLMGGLVWFSIPFALATSLGLATVALQLPVSLEEAAEGLVPPAAAYHMLGRGGAVLVTLMIFLAVTSTGSGELVAVSNIMTYNVYHTYINPTASETQLMLVSRCVIVVFGLAMGVLAVILKAIGLSLGYVYLMMGVIIGAGVVPVAYSVLWSECTANGAIAGAIGGQILGILMWIITAASDKGVVSIESTGSNYAMLVGNIVSIVSSGVICTVISKINPDNFDFEATKNIRGVSSESGDHLTKDDLDEVMLLHSKAWILRWGGGLVVVLLLLWPLLSLAAGDFSLGYFSFWVVISFLWSLVAAAVIIALPLYESAGGIYIILLGILSGGRSIASARQTGDAGVTADSVQLITQNPLAKASSEEA